MYTRVKGYKNKELLNRVKSLPSFRGIPKGYWILAVRSGEDTPNIFDDKVYIFKGEKFIMVMPGTTNTGTWGLLNYFKYGASGAGVIKADEWYINVWRRGKHRGKVEALVQVGKLLIIRDKNKNLKSGDKGRVSWEAFKGFNFHPNSYRRRSGIISWVIGKWSVGCVVINDLTKYWKFMRISKKQSLFTLCLINEF